MKAPKRLVARAIAATGLAFVSLVTVAGAAEAGTITEAGCLARVGTTVIDHGAWTGCHGPGMGSSGVKIVG